MTLEELKLRRLAGQHLLEKSNVNTVLRDLCGVQAQYLSHALHSLKIRCSDLDEFNTDELIKSWSLRGTMHIFAKEDLPLFLHRGRELRLRPCDTLEGDEFISKQRKEFFAQIILEAVSSGTEEREALRELCRQKGMSGREELSLFNSWGGTLRALCERGDLYHRPRSKKAFALCPAFEAMEEDDAWRQLLCRYFRNYGPASLQDAAGFLGCTQSRIKALLPGLSLEELSCEGSTYYCMEGGAGYPAQMPDCIFLAGFDQLMLGYRKENNPFLPKEHIRGIFSLSGMVHPAILFGGRVAGRWKKEASKLSIWLFEALTDGDKARIGESALQLWPELRRTEFIEEFAK